MGGGNKRPRERSWKSLEIPWASRTLRPRVYNFGLRGRLPSTGNWFSAGSLTYVLPHLFKWKGRVGKERERISILCLASFFCFVLFVFFSFCACDFNFNHHRAQQDKFFVFFFLFGFDLFLPGGRREKNSRD